MFFPFFPNKLTAVVRHWSKGEETGRQGMRAPKRIEQLKCRYRGSEKKESELNHRFQCFVPLGNSACFWPVNLRWVIWVHLIPFLQSTHLPCHREALRYLHWVPQCRKPHCTDTCHCTVYKDKVMELIFRIEVVG